MWNHKNLHFWATYSQTNSYLENLAPMLGVVIYEIQKNIPYIPDTYIKKLKDELDNLNY